METNTIQQVETEIWEPGEKPGYLRYVGQRTRNEVFKDLQLYLEQHGMLPDEYFLPSATAEKGSLFPKDAQVFAYANYGANEGVYLDVDFVGDKGIEHFATGKTLSEGRTALDHMYLICSAIMQSFWGDPNVHARYCITPTPGNCKERDLEALYNRVKSIHDRIDKLDEAADATRWIADALHADAWNYFGAALEALEAVVGKMENDRRI